MNGNSPTAAGRIAGKSAKSPSAGRPEWLGQETAKCGKERAGHAGREAWVCSAAHTGWLAGLKFLELSETQFPGL